MKRTLWLLLFFVAAGAAAQTQDVAIQDVSVNAQRAASTSGFFSGLSISNNMTHLFAIGGNPCVPPTCTPSIDPVNTTGARVYGTVAGAPAPAAFIDLSANLGLLGASSTTGFFLKNVGGAGVWTAPARVIGHPVMSPGAAEDIVWGFTTEAATVTSWGCALKNGSATPSVTFTMKYGTDLTSLTAITTTPAATTSVTTIATQTLNNTAVSANSFFVLQTTAQSGTVPQAWCHVAFTTP